MGERCGINRRNLKKMTGPCKISRNIFKKRMAVRCENNRSILERRMTGRCEINRSVLEKKWLVAVKLW